MYKKCIIFCILILCFGVIGVGLAQQKGNPQKGKMLFAKNCRTCHAEGSKAKPLYPGRAKQADWQSAFAKEKYLSYPCKETWQKMPESDYQDLLMYFLEGAADGVMPRGCG
jgi:cytochrome c5